MNVFVTEEDVRKLVMPPAPQNDLALLRDQAAAAFLFLSGMRATAFVTLHALQLIWRTHGLPMARAWGQNKER